MNPREFTARMPTLLACGALMPEQAGLASSPMVQSGIFKPTCNEVPA